MATKFKNLLQKLNIRDPPTDDSGFSKATKDGLFPQTNPTVDGEECLHDCSSCTVKYPNKFSIDESDELYGHINGWSRHLIVATGKTDWVRDVTDEKGSVMEAVGKHNDKHEGKLMLSASNIPVPEKPEVEDSTTCLLLPAFTIVDNVTPSLVSDLITHVINAAPTNTTALGTTAEATTTIPTELRLKTRPCPHNYLILLCSQKTRDARCGQSAPLLKKELERHLRPLGLYRDLHDERPGGVGIYFISHVGGHKYSANMMIYRREGAAGVVSSQATKEANDAANGVNTPATDSEKSSTTADRQAAQCIWLARIKPEDCENLVRYTILQGKVVKPSSQLRGGFDRARQLISW